MESESEALRAKAEEGKAELDALADLQNLKAEVAFNSALAGVCLLGGCEGGRACVCVGV